MAEYSTEKKLGVSYIFLDGREGVEHLRTIDVGGVLVDVGWDGFAKGVELMEALTPKVGYEHE